MKRYVWISILTLLIAILVAGCSAQSKTPAGTVGPGLDGPTPYGPVSTPTVNSGGGGGITRAAMSTPQGHIIATTMMIADLAIKAIEEETGGRVSVTIEDVGTINMESNDFGTLPCRGEYYTENNSSPTTIPAVTQEHAIDLNDFEAVGDKMGVSSGIVLTSIMKKVFIACSLTDLPASDAISSNNTMGPVRVRKPILPFFFIPRLYAGREKTRRASIDTKNFLPGDFDCAVSRFSGMMTTARLAAR
jgi:hypothetical protein